MLNYFLFLKDYWIKNIIKILFVLFLVIIGYVLFIYIRQVNHFNSIRNGLFHKDSVFVVNTYTDLYARVGKSPKCGETDCWVLPSNLKQENNKWIKQNRDQVGLAGSKEAYQALEDGIVYYNLKINVPDAVFYLKDQLYLVSNRLFVQEATFFINGKSRTPYFFGKNKVYSILVSKKDLVDGTLSIIIKSKVNSLDLGISGKPNFYIASKDFVYKYIESFDYHFNNPHFQIMIIIFFCLIFYFALFITLPRNKYYSMFFTYILNIFLVYLLVARGDCFYIGDYNIVFLIGPLKIINGLLFLRFFWKYFNLGKDKIFNSISVASFIFSSIVLCYFINPNHVFSLREYLLFIKGSYALCILVCVAITYSFNSLYLGSDEVSYRQRNDYIGLFLFIITYFLFSLFFTFQRVDLFEAIQEVSVCFFILYYLVKRVGEDEKRIFNQDKKIKDLVRDNTIGQTASLLAHDIRRPFSQIKMILDNYRDIKKDPVKLYNARKNIHKSIKSVEVMASEIMDFVADIEIEKKPCSLLSIIDHVLRESLQAFLNKQVVFNYDLKASHMIQGDHPKLIRIVENILFNALEAIFIMGKQLSGEITIKSDEYVQDNKRYIKIEIINNGPIIPEDKIESIFVVFKSHGKNKGRGLGLSSVKKIIDHHEGTIMAENLPKKKGVKFTIYIPASEELEYGRIELLPRQIKKVQKEFIQDTRPLETALMNLSTFNGTIPLLILDDQKLYRDWVEQLVQECFELQSKVCLYHSTNVDDALEKVKNHQIPHAIVDIDLQTEETGLDFIKQAQESFPNLSILIHSNRYKAQLPEINKLISDNKKIFNFVPKPLTSEDLIFFINDALDLSYHLTGESDPSADWDQIKNVESKSKMKTEMNNYIIYLCDDNTLIRVYLKKKIMDALELIDHNHDNVEIMAFEKGEDLLEATKNDFPHLVFSDYYMHDTGGELSGIDVIEAIKKQKKDCPSYLVSNSHPDEMKIEIERVGGNGMFSPNINISDLKDVIISHIND